MPSEATAAAVLLQLTLPHLGNVVPHSTAASPLPLAMFYSRRALSVLLL
jgi:hypothetical protein